MKTLTILGLGLLFFVACSTSKSSSSTHSLEDVSWVLHSFDGKPYEPKLTQSQLVAITMQTDGNRVVGFGGCNSFSGSYTLDGTTIQFTLISTKKFCQETMEVENYLFQTLTKVEYSIDVDVLTLKNENGKSVTFKKS